MILLKNNPSLFMSAKHIKNEVLRDTMWNIINSRNVFKLNDLINKVLPILNVKFADLAVILSRCADVSNCCNT